MAVWSIVPTRFFFLTLLFVLFLFFFWSFRNDAPDACVDETTSSAVETPAAGVSLSLAIVEEFPDPSQSYFFWPHTTVPVVLNATREARRVSRVL